MPTYGDLAQIGQTAVGPPVIRWVTMHRWPILMPEGERLLTTGEVGQLFEVRCRWAVRGAHRSSIGSLERGLPPDTDD